MIAPAPVLAVQVAVAAGAAPMRAPGEKTVRVEMPPQPFFDAPGERSAAFLTLAESDARRLLDQCAAPDASTECRRWLQPNAALLAAFGITWTQTGSEVAK